MSCAWLQSSLCKEILSLLSLRGLLKQRAAQGKLRMIVTLRVLGGDPDAGRFQPEEVELKVEKL